MSIIEPHNELRSEAVYRHTQNHYTEHDIIDSAEFIRTVLNALPDLLFEMD